MQYVIGTDEAGYGPNLGPLVVSATLWQVPEGVRAEDLYKRLEKVISPVPERADKNPHACVAMADSKVLYQSGKGLRNLERGLWAAMTLLDQQPETCVEVWDALAPESARDLAAIPWYAEYDPPVPIDAEPEELQPLARALGRAMAAAGVRLLELYSRAVFPERFNELVEQHESKGAALSHLTLELAAHLMQPLESGSISLVCDKHGGRDHYAVLLSEHFPGAPVEVRGESRRQSVYQFGPSRRRVEVCFSAKAESYLPVALASMASKYLRELAMEAFNDFWCDRVPELQPTAGYPQDAKRFKKDIAVVQAELGIEDRVLWRNK